MKNSNELSPSDSVMTDNEKMRKRLLVLGITVSILVLWNGVCDYIFVYSSQLSGDDYTTSAYFKVVLSANGRPHWMVMLAQTAGWLYPIYALAYYHMWIGMRRAGFWLARVPLVILAYSILMIGGVQHIGFAYLSVLEQAKAVVGCTDMTFFAQANKYIIEHFLWGDLTGLPALFIGAIWHAVGILSGKTMYPRWFVVVSPLGVLLITNIIGSFLPAPIAGFVLVPFGTYFMFVPIVASTIWLWKHYDY